MVNQKIKSSLIRCSVPLQDNLFFWCFNSINNAVNLKKVIKAYIKK